MKIALQYANKRDECTMALFSKPKRKFRLNNNYGELDDARKSRLKMAGLERL